MSRRRPALSVLTVVIGGLVWPALWLHAENWPVWRGPHADGISREAELPTEWMPDSDEIVWKVPLPGRGHSSPIIWDDKVFITSAVKESEERLLLKLDRDTGAEIWRQTVLRAPFESIHPLNSHASSTPATDGRLVFVTFLDRVEYYVAAYDFSGKPVWEARPGPFSSKHGFCSSPILHRDRLILNGDHDGESFLTVLDKETGQEIWKVRRANKTRSYSVPRILKIGGKEQVVLTGSLATSGFDAETGELLWTVDGPSEQMVASIVEEGDLIFAMGGFPERHLLAIRKGGIGDITDSHIVWRTHRSVPYVPSPLLYGHLLHVVSDEGMYSCFDPPTGKRYQQKRISSHISSSLVGGAGHIYVTDDRGTTTVLENSSDYSIVARNSVGEEVYSTPALSQGSIFIRGEEHLFRIGR